MGSSSNTRAGIDRQAETTDLSVDLAQSSPERSLYGDPEGFRDLLRELIYGAPNAKSIAIDLFGAEKLGNSYSRLSHALQPRVDGASQQVNFDVDWVVPAVAQLSRAARRSSRVSLRLKARERGPAGSMPSWLRNHQAAFIFAALESRIEKHHEEEMRDLRELAELRAEFGGEKKGRR